MKYLIGLDGGGTKTQCVITDFKLKVISESAGGPSNFLMLGTETVSETLFDLISECISKAGIDFGELAAAVLGTTGAGRKKDAEKLGKDFVEFAKNKGVDFNSFSVESDARIALEGAFSGKPGTILIAGTGSIMFGKDRKGEIHRVGGFGRLIGDEGSGYMIGRKGLIALAKEYDGRGGKTLLAGLVDEKFGISNPANLITEIYNNKFDIASAAPLVINAAEKGDPICISILEDETKELIRHVEAMKKLLMDASVKLCLIGGIISTGNYFSKLFEEKINKAVPGVQINKPDYPPVMGAILMAKERSRK